MPEIIVENGGTPVRTRVGHSFIKAQMAETGAVFGGEHSAHYYFRDFWGADSGMLAAMHVLAALGEQAKPLSELMGVYDRYAASGEKLVAKAREVTANDSDDSKIGPITMPSQLPIIKSHIEDALARGGRALVGGIDAVGTRFVQPTVLVDVPEDSIAVTQETFGPTVTVAKVDTMDEAVEYANATKYGLAATVFSKARGMELADRIRSGMASVNGIITFAGVPNIPFGGVGESGFGRIHGADGLREFTYSKGIARKRFNPLLNLTSFARTAAQEGQLTQLMTLLHGRSGTIK